MDERSGGAGDGSQAQPGCAPSSSPNALKPKLNKYELNDLVKVFYDTRDPQILETLLALPIERKVYLATRKPFKEFIMAVMYEVAIGSERISKNQFTAAKFFAKMMTQAKKEQKAPPNIKEGAEVIDTDD